MKGDGVVSAVDDLITGTFNFLTTGSTSGHSHHSSHSSHSHSSSSSNSSDDDDDYYPEDWRSDDD